MTSNFIKWKTTISFGNMTPTLVATSLARPSLAQVSISLFYFTFRCILESNMYNKHGTKISKRIFSKWISLYAKINNLKICTDRKNKSGNSKFINLFLSFEKCYIYWYLGRFSFLVHNLQTKKSHYSEKWRQ